MQTTATTAQAADLAQVSQQAPALDAAPAATFTVPTLQPGEHYAGIVLGKDGAPTHHLVLMAQRPDEDLAWQPAMDWAASVGGTLPTRQEQALLFANCKANIQPEWHWSCEEYEGSASCAWDCYFCYGYQDYHRKSYEGSVVAVRRLPLNPSIL